MGRERLQDGRICKEKVFRESIYGEKRRQYNRGVEVGDAIERNER